MNAQEFFDYLHFQGDPIYKLIGPSMEPKEGNVQEWSHYMPGSVLEVNIINLNW